MNLNAVSGWRMRAMIVLFLVLAVVVLVRVVIIQVVEHEEHEAFANRTWTIDTRGPRGAILDRNGFPLATSVDHWEVHVDTRLWERSQFQPTPASARLAELLRTDQRTVLSLAAQTAANGGVDALIAFVPYALGATIHAEALHGVNITKSSSRRYLEGEMAGQIIGIVGRDEQGLAGVEYMYETTLGGEAGLLIYEQDGLGQPIPFGSRAERPYRDGADVVLTIDRNLQRIAEEALADAVTKRGARGGVIVMMDPRTGDILAAATLPTYNPATLDLADPDFDLGVLRSTVASDVYEPGSTFKVITMAAGLDAGVVSPYTTFIDTGAVVVGNRTIRNFDFSFHGEQTMTQILQRSLNTGTVWLAEEIGARTFYEYVYGFGFGEPTDAGLPAESAGLVTDNTQITWSPLQLATNSFGQGIAVTPLQIVQAYSTIANGGVTVKPRIVRAVIDKDGIQTFDPVEGERVISEETAATLTTMMQAVVDGVLDHPAQADGWRVAGKSGTSDVIEDGVYLEETSLASFAGFAPADDPRLVVLVRIDYPQGEIYGGVVAAPVFSRVISEALPYLAVPPTSYVARPDDWNTGPADAPATPVTQRNETSDPDDDNVQEEGEEATEANEAAETDRSAATVEAEE